MKPRLTFGTVLVTAVFWTLFAVTAPIATLLTFLIRAVTAPFDPDRKWPHLFVCHYSVALLRFNPFWDLQVIGREKLPEGPAVLVANHSSMADIPVCMALFREFKFVSKHSLFNLPLVGWCMRLIRHVSVDRASASAMGRMMADCQRWLSRGVKVLIYPEGTYSADGKLLPFKRGAFSLAVAGQLPLVPIVLEGTRSLVVEDGPWMFPRCRIRVRVLDPILPAQFGGDDAALAKEVRALFERELSAALPKLPT